MPKRQPRRLPSPPEPSTVSILDKIQPTDVGLHRKSLRKLNELVFMYRGYSARVTLYVNECWQPAIRFQIGGVLIHDYGASEQDRKGWHVIERRLWDLRDARYANARKEIMARLLENQ